MGVRGEVAAFVDDNFQSPSSARAGHSLDAGRRGRSPRRRLPDQRDGALPSRSRRADSGDAVVACPGVVSADRTFSRERYALRAFGVANTSEGSGFCPRHRTGELGDNLALEGSIGWFVGEGRDLIGRFADSDFIYVRLKHYF